MSASIDGSSDCEGSSAAMAVLKVLTIDGIKEGNADRGDSPFSFLF